MSIRYRHIACCMDESTASEEALAHAIDLAEAGGSRFSLVHVGPFPLIVDEIDGTTVARREDLNQSAREWIQKRTAAVAGAQSVFLEGAAGPAICDWADEADVDLLVVGAHHGRVESLLLGSVSGHLVNHALCPVLVVRCRPVAAPRHREHGHEETTR